MIDSIQKGQAIKDGLRRGFQDGTPKMVQRRCYGYDIGLNSQLTINPDEAIISDEMFQAVQQKKLGRAKNPENVVAMDLITF